MQTVDVMIAAHADTNNAHASIHTISDNMLLKMPNRKKGHRKPVRRSKIVHLKISSSEVDD